MPTFGSTRQIRKVSLALALDPGVARWWGGRRGARLTSDEPPSDPGPALMLRQRVVELVSDAMESGKFSPGDGREIVMLVVVADLVGARTSSEL